MRELRILCDRFAHCHVAIAVDHLLLDLDPAADRSLVASTSDMKVVAVGHQYYTIVNATETLCVHLAASSIVTFCFPNLKELEADPSNPIDRFANKAVLRWKTCWTYCLV